MKNTVILCAILTLGFILRCYNLNFPSIGYHNMIENEYLIMAQEMQRTQDYISKRVYYQNGLDDNPIVKSDFSLPLVSYQILFSWRFLGENLWGPRLFNVLFGILSIAIIYLIALRLFNSIGISLSCALLLAIMPLGIFFSRNLQPESPAFFFMLLSNLFYLRFASSFKGRHLFLGGLFLSIACLYKINFLISILPFFFYFPFKALFEKRKKFLKYSLIFFLPYLFSVIIYIFWLRQRQSGQWQWEGLNLIKLFDLFSFSYWKKSGGIILWYIKGENFGPVFSILALLGMMLAFIKEDTLLERYIIGWTLAIVPYAMVNSEVIVQQNFFQTPFLAMVCISCSYVVSFVAKAWKKKFPKDLPLYLMAAIVSLSIPFIYQSLRNMHSTVFVGTDVAGEALRNLTEPTERIFLLTHAQGYAISRYAQRYVGWTSDLEDFKKKEDKFKIRYICIYPIELLEGLSKGSPGLLNYIQDNYSIKEMGFKEGPNQAVYLILKKGKGQNLKESLKSLSGETQLRAIYRLFGKYFFLYALIPDTERQKNQ